jgi:hypothetical protein
MSTYPRHLLPISPPPEDESRVGRDGSQVDGACRDLLETVTHGPHGDIGGIYTTFPWPSPEMIRPKAPCSDRACRAPSAVKAKAIGHVDENGTALSALASPRFSKDSLHLETLPRPQACPCRDARMKRCGSNWHRIFGAHRR